MGGPGMRALAVIAAVLIQFMYGFSPAWAQNAASVRIVDVYWGFDGRVVDGEFQPFSLLLDNLSDEAIEGTLSIQKVSGLIRSEGARHEVSVFLGPSSRRWVQFYPYISGNLNSWQIQLQTESATLDLGQRAQPEPVWEAGVRGKSNTIRLVTVLLDPAASLQRQPTSIRHMPEDVFPPYATATHGLHALFMDHVPEWEEPRQTALMAWLQRGGELHLMLDRNRQRLRFSGILSGLNEPFSEFAVGAGRVLRHEFQRNDLSEEVVNAAAIKNFDLREDEVTMYSRQLVALMSLSDSSLFDVLSKQVEPSHAWWLIGLCCLMYAAIMYPGCWQFSQRKNIRAGHAIAAVLITVAVFSGLFLWLGQRGYGESSSWRSYGIAESEDSTHWSCLQFSELFVTDGMDCRVEDKGRQTLFASGLDEESTGAVVTAGDNASLISRLPPFSREPMVTRRRLEMPDWESQVESFLVNGEELSQLTIRVGKRFPSGETTKAWVAYGDRIHGLTLDERSGQLVVSGSARYLREFCDVAEWGNMPVATLTGAPEGEITERQFVDALLVRRGLKNARRFSLGDLEFPRDRVILMVRTAMPAAFGLSVVPEFPQRGEILFVKELPLVLAP